MFIHRDKRAAVYDKNTGAILARAKHWQSLLLIVWLYILEMSCSANTFPLAEAQGSDATNQSAFSFSFSFLDTCIDLWGEEWWVSVWYLYSLTPDCVLVLNVC